MNYRTKMILKTLCAVSIGGFATFAGAMDQKANNSRKPLVFKPIKPQPTREEIAAKKELRQQKAQQAREKAGQDAVACMVKLAPKFEQIDNGTPLKTESRKSERRQLAALLLAPMKKEDPNKVQMKLSIAALDLDQAVHLELPSYDLYDSFMTPATSPAKSLPISAQFSTKRPAVLRDREEITRIKNRANLVANNAELSDGTWDNRAARNLLLDLK